MNFLIYKTLLMFFVCAPICGHLNIVLLPNQGSEVRLMCMLVKHWYHIGWLSKRCSHTVLFYVNGKKKTSIPYKNCQRNNNDDYSYSCSGCRRILTIKNINNNKNSNSTWHCEGDEEESGKVFIPATVAPPCDVNTKIDYDVPVNNLSLDGSLTLVEGDSIRLNCSSQAGRENNGANPNFQYLWTIYHQATRKGEIEGNSTEIVKQGMLVKHNISRFDAGMYVCSSTFNSTCKSSDTANLNVLYPPSVNITTTMSENGEVNISCLIIPGNPFNTTSQGWRHVVDGQVVEEHPAEVDDNFTIYLPRPSVFDDGEYVCYASNDVRDVRGSVNQTKSTVIQAKVPPYPIDSQDGVIHVERDTLIRLSETVLGGNITNITAYRQHKDDTIQLILENTTIDMISVSINMSGKSITRQAIRVTSHTNMAVDKETKSMNVTLQICNEFECMDRMYNVVFTESDRNNYKPEVGQSYLPYIIGGICVLLVLVFIFVFMVFKRKRTKKSSETRKTSTDSFRYLNPTFEPKTDQDENVLVNGKASQSLRNSEIIESIENKLYSCEDDQKMAVIPQPQRQSSTEVLENEFYVSAEDDEPGKAKRQEVEVLENEFYVSAEDDEPGEAKRQEVDILENEFYVSGD